MREPCSTMASPGKSMKLSDNISTTDGKAFQQAIVLALSFTLIMLVVTWSGIFDTATVELGLEHYAEQPLSWLPHCIPMPLNTVINLGYMLCAVYWTILIHNCQHDGSVTDDDAYFFFVFNTFGFLYGFVQLYRIIVQTLFSAIMDQWYTLPFFMMVYVWAQSARGKSSWLQFYALMSVSVVSYTLTLMTSVGFELSLGCHILLAVIGASSLYRENPSDLALRYFTLGLAACSGFVVLKLMDHHLPLVHWIFSYVSGHFLSKICDVLQLHCVSRFFFAIVRKSADTNEKTKKVD